MFRSYGLAASIIKYINPYAKRFMVDPECRGFFFLVCMDVILCLRYLIMNC